MKKTENTSTFRRKHVFQIYYLGFLGVTEFPKSLHHPHFNKMLCLWWQTCVYQAWRKGIFPFYFAEALQQGWRSNWHLTSALNILVINALAIPQLDKQIKIMSGAETAVQHFFPVKSIAFSFLSLCQTIQAEMLSVCYEVDFSGKNFY